MYNIYKYIKQLYSTTKVSLVDRRCNTGVHVIIIMVHNNQTQKSRLNLKGCQYLNEHLFNFLQQCFSGCRMKFWWLILMFIRGYKHRGNVTELKCPAHKWSSFFKKGVLKILQYSVAQGITWPLPLQRTDSSPLSVFMFLSLYKGSMNLNTFLITTKLSVS